MSPRILVPIDFGAHGDELLRAAARFCRGSEAHLTLLHVCETEGAADASRGLVRAMVLLEEARQQLQTDGPILVDLALTQGSAAREIVRFARERAFDLIVVGPQSEALADSIRSRASCPVITLAAASGKHRALQPSAVNTRASAVTATWS